MSDIYGVKYFGTNCDDEKFVNMAPIKNTIQLEVNEYKPGTNNYKKIFDSDKVAPPKETDVFINNGRRNHLQYLSLQDTPYTTTLPFNLKNGEIQPEIKNKIINNSKLFNPNNDGTKEDYYSNRKIANYAPNNIYNVDVNGSSVENDNVNESYYKRRTYTADGILYYQKPHLYFRKLVKVGKTDTEEIQDGIIQTDTYINNANQTLYSMLSEQPKTLIFYNVYELIKDISNAKLRPREEDLTDNITNKVNINTMNFDNIYDTNISDSIPQYLLKYNKDSVNESSLGIKDSTIKTIQEIQKKSFIKINTPDNPILKLNNIIHDSNVYNDISQNELLNNVGAGQIVFYWSFDNIYPRNKEIFIDASGSITKLFQPFDYRNKISYLKNIRTSNLLPRVENINIYIRKHEENNFNGLINDINVTKSTIKHNWIKIMSLPQINRESYLNAIKISKNKIYEYYQRIKKREKELFDKFIGNNNYNDEAAKNNRVNLGNFLIDNSLIYYYLDLSGSDSTFYIDKDDDGKYIDSSFNFLPYYFKKYINLKAANKRSDILSTRDKIKTEWETYMNNDNLFLKDVIGDIIENDFDVKIVLVNNAVVDLMEKIMLDGHRLELIENDYNTLMFYKMNFGSGYEPTLPFISISFKLDNNNVNDVFYINFDISVNFIEDDTSYDLSGGKINTLSSNSDKILQYIEYVFIEKDNYRLEDKNLDLSGEQITMDDIKLYDFDGNKIIMNNIAIDSNDNNIFNWLQTFDDTNNYDNSVNSINSHAEIISEDGTYYRITFNYKKTLGFMDISGLDYKINLWATDEEENFNDDDDNLVKENLIKNPDNFYIIRDISNIIDTSHNDFYDISFSNFKTNLNEDISNNFNFDPEFYNEFESIRENIGDIIKNNFTEFFFILNDDDTINNLQNYNDKHVKDNKDEIIESIKNRIIECIINNTVTVTTTPESYENLVKYIKYYNGSDSLEDDNDDEVKIKKLLDDLKNDDNPVLINQLAEKMYNACKYKKFKYYIFRIEKYITRPRKRIKYSINTGENNNNIGISLTNKVFIDISSNFDNISNNQKYDSENKLLDSGVLYNDIYARVLNNNRDNDGDNTKPSLFSRDRNNKYIKIWTKIDNNKITPYFNSEKSIFNTLHDNYNKDNTDISTNFDISNNIDREKFEYYNLSDDLNSIIYLNQYISSKDKLDLYIGNKDKKNIIEISKYTKDNSENNVDITGLGKSINGELCTISLNYPSNSKKDSYTFNHDSQDTSNSDLNILDISNVKITNDKLRIFFEFGVKNIDVNSLISSNNEQKIILNIDNSYNNIKDISSNIGFYVDDISENPTVTEVNIDLSSESSVVGFKLFGIDYIDYFDLSYADINIRVEDLFGKFKALNQEINDKGFLIINLYNSFEIFDQSNLLITDEYQYKFKFDISSIKNDNDNDNNIYNIDFKRGKNYNENIISNKINDSTLKKLRYKNEIKSNDIKNNNKFIIDNENYKLRYHSRNNFTFYGNNKVINDDIFNNSQDITLSFNNDIKNTFKGDILYDIMNEKFYNFYMNNTSSDNNYEYYELSGIKINSNKYIVYDDNAGVLNDDSVNNAFFDYNDFRGGPTSRKYPQRIHFDNFNNKWDNEKINFIPIQNDFTRSIFNFNDISYSLLCEVGDGKLINQDIDFDKDTIFNKNPNLNDKADYTNPKTNYQSKLKTDSSIINGNESENIQECNIKWIALNNELYYDLLFDPKNNFKNYNESFLLHKINSTLGRAMEHNGGLILGRNGKPTGFYLCQLFRREPLHKYVIIIKDQPGEERGKLYAIIDIGSHAYWTQNISVDKFYNYNFTNIINGSNQSSHIINESFYSQIPGTNYSSDTNEEPSNETHYIFNKCWPTSHYNFIKQTKEPGYNYEERGFKHYYLFGF